MISTFTPRHGKAQLMPNRCHQCAGPLGRLGRRVAGVNLCGPRCERAFYRGEEPIEPLHLTTAQDLGLEACVADVKDLQVPGFSAR